MASATERLQLILEAQVRGTEELQKLNAAMDRFGKSTTDSGTAAKAAGVSFDGFGDKVANAIRNPLEAASQAAGTFAKSLGSTGTVALGIGSVYAALGATVFNLAKAYGDLYEQQSNNAQRLGVSIREYGLLARVSTEAGLSGDALVGTMRGLSKALSDNSEEGAKAKAAMSKWGIAATDAFGAARPMRDVILEIADQLGKIQNPAEKADAAIKIMGKGALEVLPLMNSELRQQFQEMERAGAGWTKYGEKVGAATDKWMDAFDRKWAKISKAVKEKAAVAFLAAVDNDASWAMQQEEQYRQQREAETRGVRLAGGIRGDGASPFAPGVSNEQLAAADLLRRRQAIAGMTGGGLQDRLSATKRDLDEAIQSADISAVRRLQAEYKGLEAQIKATAAAEQERNKYATYNANVMAAFLAGGSRKTDNTGLLNPGQIFVGGPSLLRPGESVNRGMLGIDPAVFQRNQANALTRSQSATDFAARRTEASAFPGFELQAATTAAAIRIAGLQQAKTLGMDVFQAEMEHGRIMQDLDLQRLNIQRQKLSELRQQGASLFNALTAGGGGLMNYGKGLLMGTGSTLFSNAFAQIGSGLSGKFTLPGQGTQANPSFLGKILAGTPFGMDPAATATNANTMATIANTAALTSMRIGGGMGGGAAMDAYKLLNGFGGGGWSGTGQQATDAYMAASGFGNNVGGPSLTSKIGAYAGLAAGGYGIYAGASQGGLRGATTAAASAAGMVAMLPTLMPAIGKALPMLGPIGAAASIALAMVPLLMGDPKKKRGEQLTSEAKSRYSEMPVGTDYATDIYGNKTDYNRRGELRPIINLTINAIDSQGVGEAMRQAINEYPPLTTELRGAMFAS